MSSVETVARWLADCPRARDEEPFPEMSLGHDRRTNQDLLYRPELREEEGNEALMYSGLKAQSDINTLLDELYGGLEQASSTPKEEEKQREKGKVDENLRAATSRDARSGSLWQGEARLLRPAGKPEDVLKGQEALD